MKEFFLLVFLQVIVWIGYLFRPLVGADPYFYLHGVCSGNLVSPDLLFYGLLVWFPCSELFFKIVLLLVWLLVLFVFLKIGCLFDKVRGWWLPFIVFSMTFFIFEFWKFENNVFGYLFAFLGFYFLFKVFLNRSWFDYRVGFMEIKFFLLVLFCFFVGLLFWRGVVYWVFVLGFFSFLFVPVFVLGLLPDFFGFFSVGMSNPNVFEHSMFIGIIYLFMTPLFLIGFLKTNKKIVLACIVLLIGCVLVLKMYVLPILFISIISFNCFKMFEKKININMTLKIWAILMTLFFLINLQTQFPTNNDYELIQNIVDKNETIENTFGTGYIIRHLGGTETYYSTYTKPIQPKGYVIELNDKNFDCLLLEESKHLRAWKCD